ncbi:NAD(P)/FAD-dependent oxidoreductase [Hoeflea sp.]|uniref:NAD(P)/FAD-dependent oxidoreductase n=1 Tax=Hoeflea sp. TaxID=1940281 RepID=UPI003A8D7BED
MRVAVIGGGIAGLSTAWSLTNAGIETTLFERGAIPNPLGASGDHHRIIRRAYGSQGGYQRRITEAYEAWDEMWDDLGRSHLLASGFLLVSLYEGDMGDTMRQGLADQNDPHETMSGAEAVRRYPYLNAKNVRDVTFSPEGGTLMCRHIAADLAKWLTDHGCSVRDHTQISSVDHETGEVRTGDGEIHQFDRIVIAAGAWVLDLVPALGSELTPWRTAVAYLEPPADLVDCWAGSPVILETGGESDGYVLPPARGAGLKFGTGRHRIKSPPDQNREVAADEARQILGYFAPTFARLDEYRVTDVVSCAYTFTRDEHFLARRIGKSTIVSACSGHGYKFGAAVGRRVARSLLDGDDPALHRWIEARD